MANQTTSAMEQCLKCRRHDSETSMGQNMKNKSGGPIADVSLARLTLNLFRFKSMSQKETVV
jgi:hypothetical protein